MTSSKSCLLIDDDLDDQLLFSMAVEKMNCTTTCVMADNGLHAIRQLERDPSYVPDLIFVDLYLPGLTGIDLLIKFKQNTRLAHVPIVIYTSSSAQSDMVRARMHGAADFITKSHDVTNLIKKLDSLFDPQTCTNEVRNDLKVSFRSQPD